MSYILAWILKCLKLYPSISLINDSAATTQPLSRSARVADAANQPLCQSGWRSQSATQPFCHSRWQSGWSSHSATLPEWLSGWCENFRHCAFNPKNANNKQTSSMPQNVVAEKNVMIQQTANHKNWQPSSRKKSTDQKMVSIAQCPSPFCRESSTGSVWVEKLPNTPWAYPTLNVGWHDNPNSFTPRKNSVTKGKARWWIRNVWVARYSSKPRVDLQARFKLNELFDEGGCVWVGSTSLDVWGPGSHIVQEEDCRTACQESHPKLRGKEDW